MAPWVILHTEGLGCLKETSIQNRVGGREKNEGVMTEECKDKESKEGGRVHISRKERGRGMDKRIRW